MVLKVNIKRNSIRKENRIVILEDFWKRPLNPIIAKELLRYVIRNQENPVITYGELALKISSDFNPQNLNVYLGNISDICKENGLPLLSAIVVNKDTRLPGEGFYHYFYHEKPMSEWENIYKQCKADIVNCTLWKDLLDVIENEKLFFGEKDNSFRL